MSENSTGRPAEQPDDGGGFDQTNSLAGDQLGESDGTAAGETRNAADRAADGDPDDDADRE
jgi:hypothetical protein